MKLIIQIPCLNEAETLPITLAELPCEVEGFDEVEILIIDDGSSDGTAEAALAHGAAHVVRMNGNQGLAHAFVAGLVAGTDLGADVIVNTDADNQYCGEDIASLVRPILKGQADIVVGARPIVEIEHFSPGKRLLQRVGSHVVRMISKTEVQDAPSGFRAMTRDAALRLNVFNGFTYTIETIIQAGLCNLRIVNVPIRVNGPTRPSRLFKGNASYIRRSIMAMLSVYLIYRPTYLFGGLAAAFLGLGLVLGVRYLIMMLLGEGTGHVQSVIACAILVLCGVFMAAIGVVAYLLGINRRLLEELRYLERTRQTQPGRRTSLALAGGRHGNGDSRGLISAGGARDG